MNPGRHLQGFRATRSTWRRHPPLPQERGGLLTVLPMLAVVVMLGVAPWPVVRFGVARADNLMFPAMMLVSAVGLAQSAVRRG